LAGNAMLDAGVNVSVVRLPQVHDTVRQGLITPFVEISRERGVAAYVGDGGNRWPAAHVLDVAKLYRLALDKGRAGERYHAVAEEGIPVREIAEVVGGGLGVPIRSITSEEAPQHFGWLGVFVGMDLLASGTSTRERLGWRPTGPGLIEDLKRMEYSRPVAAE
jgi:nucleoside-diphosphate-sugar epimerase